MIINESRNDSICVFDIDDTLLYSKSQIGIKTPNDKEFKYVNTDDFVEIKKNLPKDTEFDFSEFVNYKNIYYSIVNGKPNIKILKVLDNAINSGFKIGILTARGNQDAIFYGLNNFLLYRNKNGDLIDLPKNQFNKKYVFAVNDINTNKFLSKFIKGNIADSSEMKAFILKYIFKQKYGFKNIYFYDDDPYNIEAVKNLNDKDIKAIKV